MRTVILKGTEQMASLLIHWQMVTSGGRKGPKPTVSR